MFRSHVVAGGGRGVGRAIVERLLADGAAVVVVELDPDELAWTGSHPAGPRLMPVVGSAADAVVAGQAADQARSAGRFTGWVNNAAVFRDAALDTVPAHDILDLIMLNLAPAVVGFAGSSPQAPAVRSSTSPAIRRSGPCEVPCPTPSRRRPSRV